MTSVDPSTFVVKDIGEKGILKPFTGGAGMYVYEIVPMIFAVSYDPTKAYVPSPDNATDIPSVVNVGLVKSKEVLK